MGTNKTGGYPENTANGKMRPFLVAGNDFESRRMVLEKHTVRLRSAAQTNRQS